MILSPSGYAVTGLPCRHPQYIGDGEALVFDLQRFTFVASVLAVVAMDADDRYEVHLDDIHDLAASGLAADPLDVETELSDGVTAGLCSTFKSKT